MSAHDPISKDELIAKRKEFFDAIVEQLSMSPHEVDLVMNQGHLYFPPDQESLLSMPEQGCLLVNVKPVFSGRPSHFCYSIYLAGDILRIGLLLYGREIESAPVLDEQQEISKIWPNSLVEPNWRGDTILYEWTFDLKGLNFYRDYESQERFILGMRHMHFRVLRIFSDAMEKFAPIEA